MLRLCDLEAIAAIAKKRHNIVTCADNTFASPYVQRPLELGFDIVMHSTTKYLNGHSDIVSGCAVVGENTRDRGEARLSAQCGGGGRLPLRRVSGASRA